MAPNATTPPSTTSQIISREVTAVEIASTPKIAHSSESFFRVSFVNFTVDRAMIAITAAPIP